MATVLEPTGRFEIGRVFGRSFGVITRNLLLYLGLAVLLVGVPVLVIKLLAPGPRTAAEVLVAGGVPWKSMAGGAIVSYILGLVLQATLVRATIEDLSDRQPKFGDCLATGFQLLLPILGIAIVSGFGIVFASLALIVPGIIVALMWCLAVPAEVAERGGVFVSLGRSAGLTSGNRWKILGLVIITYIVVLIIDGVIVALVAPLGMTVIAVVSSLLRAISLAVFATIVAATYVELRTVKEGADISSLAAVFA